MLKKTFFIVEESAWLTDHLISCHPWEVQDGIFGRSTWLQIMGIPINLIQWLLEEDEVVTDWIAQLVKDGASKSQGLRFVRNRLNKSSKFGSWNFIVLITELTMDL